MYVLEDSVGTFLFESVPLLLITGWLFSVTESADFGNGLGGSIKI